MPFNVLGFTLASAMTRDMADRNRATQLSLVGGMLGSNLAGVVLLAAVANQGRPGVGTPVLTPGTGATSPPAPTPAPLLVQVPDVAGSTQDEAARNLRAHGLVPTAATVETGGSPIDEVLGTDPPYESVVPRNSTVEILVSAGIPVPDVRGKKADEAVKILADAGFESEQTDSEKHGGKDGTVESQEPAGGEHAEGDSIVTLFVYSAKRRGALRAAKRDES
jgi:hypothetical protein